MLFIHCCVCPPLSTGVAKQQLTRSQVKRIAREEKLAKNNSTRASGLSTSLAFTPVQGLELENPLARLERVRAANEKFCIHVFSLIRPLPIPLPFFSFSLFSAHVGLLSV